MENVNFSQIDSHTPSVAPTNIEAPRALETPVIDNEADRANEHVAPPAPRPNVPVENAAGRRPVKFEPEWGDMVNEKRREQMVVNADYKRGVWKVEPGSFNAAFIEKEAAVTLLAGAGLQLAVTLLGVDDLKKYNPDKDAVIYFEEAVALKCADDDNVMPTRVVKISRGKNTINRERIA